MFTVRLRVKRRVVTKAFRFLKIIREMMPITATIWEKLVANRIHVAIFICTFSCSFVNLGPVRIMTAIYFSLRGRRITATARRVGAVPVAGTVLMMATGGLSPGGIALGTAVVTFLSVLN